MYRDLKGKNLGVSRFHFLYLGSSPYSLPYFFSAYGTPVTFSIKNVTKAGPTVHIETVDRMPRGKVASGAARAH